MAENYSDDDWRRLNEELRKAILRGYPNPERVGCPGTDVLRQLAAQQLAVGHPAYSHVMECAPCYQELMDLRKVVPVAAPARSRSGLRIWVPALAVGIVLCAGISYYELSPGFHPAPARDVALNVDLQHWTVFRNDVPGKPRPPLELPRQRLDLTFTLPVGSEDGEYDIQIASTPGGTALVSSHGTARLEDHNETLRTRLDASLLPSGGYSLEIIRQGSGPLHVPITILGGDVR